MAYGFGSGVQAGLGATDYSNYLRGALSGAQMAAQGGAVIGNALGSIGEGIGKYQENKKKLKAQEGSIKSAANFFKSALDVENSRDRPQEQIVSYISDTLSKINDSSLSTDERAAYAANALNGLSNVIQLGTKAAEEQQKKNTAAFANLVRQYGPQIPSIFDQSRYTPEERMQGTLLGLQQRDLAATTEARLRYTPAKQSDKDVLYADKVRAWVADNPGKALTPQVRADISESVYGTKPQPSSVLSPEEQIKLKQDMIRLENASKYNEGIVFSGNKAYTEGRKIDRVIAALESKPDLTGFGQGALLPFKQALVAAGVGSLENVAQQEELQTLFGDFVMGRIESTKGAVSDREMSLYEDYSPGLSKTPAGNLAILKFTKAAIDRSKELSKMVRNMRDEGKSEMQIQSAILNYQDSHPLPIEILINASGNKGGPVPNPQGTVGTPGSSQQGTVGQVSRAYSQEEQDLLKRADSIVMGNNR